MNLKHFFSRLSGNRRLLRLCFILIFLLSIFISNHKEDVTPKVKAAGSEITQAQIKQREEKFQAEILKYPALMIVINLIFLALLSAGLTLDVSVLKKKSRGERLWEGEGISRGVPWSLTDVGWVFVFLFVYEIAVTLIQSAVFKAAWLVRPNEDVLLLLNGLARDLMAVVFVFWLLKVYFQKGLDVIGLRFENWRSDIQKGFAAYVALIPVMIVVVIAMAYFVQLFSYEPEPQKVVQMYLGESVNRYLVYLTFFVAVVGPLIEEIFFRGFVYQAMRKHFGVDTAIFFSGALFALMHFNFMAFFPILFLGMLLAYLFEKTGSLAAPMAVHVFHNLSMVALTMVFKAVSG